MATCIETYEGRFYVEMTFLALVVGADADVVETVGRVVHLHAQDCGTEMVDGCIERIQART